MLRQCVVFAVLGCVFGIPQHQYQQQQAEVPPHLLRQYIAAQQQQEYTPSAQATQVLPRPAHAAAAPARLTYAVQSEPQYQQAAPQQYRPQYQAQPQYQPQQYQAQPQYQRPQQQQPAQKEPEDYDSASLPTLPVPTQAEPHPSYQFGFDVNDDQFTNYQNRKEERDGDVIKGSYSVVDSDGFIRTVTYTADPKEGFKAEVSRQPTDIVVKIPTPKPQLQQIHSQQPQQQQQQAPQQYYRYQQQ